MMFEAYRRHGILPSKIYNMRLEEKIILRAFIEMELQEGGGSV